ncbi:MAG TPA: CopG family transcriptional regulator [Baekduia sp.]|uniref:ribbon-helix-helix domain-containing protein n=1 Tax=Baekduia sp. TaxID=2600305 RepID=UPI002D7661D8|nr:CopG family transcriptional regulator [Baekduia sp.]HET6510363.1 CopG family transcriptional regulator [Baekduia sp.]
MLKKTSIYLDEELDHGLARRAAEEGITKAEYIRRTLSGAVQRPKRPKPKAVGFANVGPTDVSSNVDKYLAETGFGES